MRKKCDAVFEGGGVKGIGLAGAAAAIEDAGYEFVNLAGTSAGAIVASLLAVGYTGAEIKEVLLETDFTKFQKSGFLSSLGVCGKLANVIMKNGVYSADGFEDWLTELLKKKNKLYFGDIRTEFKEERYMYKFQAIASDISDRRMLALPGDLKLFGLDPDKFSIAKAVRMSMSIPVYYEPFVLTDNNGYKHEIVDGGLLSNYPVWLLDDNSPNPPWPTFGFKFCSGGVPGYPDSDYHDIKNFIDYTKSLVSTALDAHDKHYISMSKGDFGRTVAISPKVISGGAEKTVSTVYFNISRDESLALFNNGAQAAAKFLSGWDFSEWKRNYRI